MPGTCPLVRAKPGLKMSLVGNSDPVERRFFTSKDQARPSVRLLFRALRKLVDGTAKVNAIPQSETAWGRPVVVALQND